LDEKRFPEVKQGTKRLKSPKKVEEKGPEKKFLTNTAQGKSPEKKGGVRRKDLRVEKNGEPRPKRSVKTKTRP